MTVKARTPSAAVSTPFGGGTSAASWAAPPGNQEERLQCIKAMLQRINGYVEFMCEVSSLNGTSSEAKERAVTVFYEQMVVLERRLGRIQEDLRLG
jgi:hypothetical protein